jgi:hypothetical protein
MTTTLVMLERYRRDESNDTKKDYEQWPEWVTWAIQMYRGLFIFGLLMWHSPVIVGDLSWCRCIRLVEIFPIVSVMSLSELWCASRSFYLFFVFFSPLSSL